jgi:hypothetical protein
MDPITYDGGYGRVGTVAVQLDKCDICGETKPCLATDSTEGEYAPSVLCLPCIALIFEEEFNA